MKSCVVGIGAMGLEMALHIQNKGMDVVGVDVDQKQIAEAKQRGLSAGEDLASQVSGIDVFIVIVATESRLSQRGDHLVNNPKERCTLWRPHRPDTTVLLKCAESGVRLVDAKEVGMQGARDGNCESLRNRDDVSSNAVLSAAGPPTRKAQYRKTCTTWYWAACCANLSIPPAGIRKVNKPQCAKL